MLKLSCPGAVLSYTGPVIWPCFVLVCAQTDHRLDREAHSRLSCADGLVLRVMRDVWCAMEQLVDSMSAVCLDNAAVLRLCVLLNRISGLSEGHTRLHKLDRLLQTLARRLNHPDRFRVC